MDTRGKQEQHGRSAPALATMISPSLIGLAMAPNDDKQGATAGVFQDALSQVMAAVAVIVVGTCIGMWGTLRLIEQSIANIVKSDADQTIEIRKIQDDLNNLRVEQGVQRVRLIDMNRRFGAP